MPIKALLALAALLVTLAFPAGAAADDFQRILGDYRSDGTLDGCYSPSELHNAGRQIPPDIEQYAPGFGDALASSQGRCTGGTPPPAPEEEEAPPAPTSAGTPGPGAAAPVTKKTVREPPAPEVREASLALPDSRLEPATAAVAADTPGALIALLVAAAIAVALALAWAFAWFMGWSPERLTKPLFAAFQTVWDRLLPGR